MATSSIQVQIVATANRRRHGDAKEVVLHRERHRAAHLDGMICVGGVLRTGWYGV